MTIPIRGKGIASAAAIQAWFESLGPNYAPTYAPDKKYKAPPPGLGLAIVIECQRYPEYSLNWDYVAGQILHETAAWQSKYARERNNPGGIGAINSDPDQAYWFDTVDDGVRAHVAHLLTYTIGEGIWTRDTPRYEAVREKDWVGTATLWTDLNGKWAWPGTNYGQNIITLGNRLRTFSETYKEPPVMANTDIPGIAWIPADGRHHTKGRTQQWPDILIQHHTDGWDSLNWLTTSPNSNVSAHYLLRNNGDIRAQLVRHQDTAHTTGFMNPRSITCEWERKWPDQQAVPYEKLGQFWAKVITAERKRGNPNFQGDLRRDQIAQHKDFFPSTCAGNMNVDQLYNATVAALKQQPAPNPQPQPENPNAKKFEYDGKEFWIVNDTFNGTKVNMLDFYEKSGGIVQMGLPLTGMSEDENMPGVYRQITEAAVMEFWSKGFGNIKEPTYRFGRYLDHIDKIK